MRILKKGEARCLMAKTIKFQGENIINFMEKKFFSSELIRLQKSKIFLLPCFLETRATSFSRKNLASAGICVGCFSRSGKIRFLIPALGTMILENNENSGILNSNGENKFIFGHHPKKEDISEISKFLRKNDGVVIIGPTKLTLGFGEILKDASFLNLNLEKKTILVNHGDIGRYIRNYNK